MEKPAIQRQQQQRQNNPLLMATKLAECQFS